MKNPYLEPKWTVQNALERAGNVLRDEGAGSLFYKAAGELLYRRLLIDELRFEDVRADDTFGDHELVALEQSEFPRYLEYRSDLDEGQINGRLQWGHECHVIVVNGEVAQSCWVAPGDTARVSYLGCEIELGERDIYVYEFTVHPSHRGRKLFPAALSRLVSQYRGLGYERIIWGWLPENQRAVAVARPWPFRRLGVLGYWRCAKWRKYFCAIPDAAQPPRLASERLLGWHRRQD